MCHFCHIYYYAHDICLGFSKEKKTKLRNFLELEVVLLKTCFKYVDCSEIWVGEREWSGVKAGLQHLLSIKKKSQSKRRDFSALNN